MRTTPINRLTILIPSYNEGNTIREILERIIRVTLPNGIEKEIIVIDDCSADDTRAEVDKVIHSYPSVDIIYIKQERNRGKGYAVQTGIKHASGDVIIIQDADFEYDPSDYPLLLAPILSGEYKVVYGSRILKKDNARSYNSFYWGGRFISFVTSLLYGHKITDEPTCYKMFDAELLKSIPLTSERFGFCPEVTAKVLRGGYRIKEVPINYYPRTKSEGKKIRFKDGIEALWLLLKYRYSN